MFYTMKYLIQLGEFFDFLKISLKIRQIAAGEISQSDYYLQFKFFKNFFKKSSNSSR